MSYSMLDKALITYDEDAGVLAKLAPLLTLDESFVEEFFSSALRLFVVCS